MVDFSKIDVGVDISARPESVYLVEMPEFRNGSGAPLKFWAYDSSAPEGSREIRKWALKFSASSAKGSEEAEKPISEADLDKMMDREESSNYEYTARLIAKWNVEASDRGPVAPTLENKVGFVRAYPEIGKLFLERRMEVEAAGKKSSKGLRGSRASSDTSTPPTRTRKKAVKKSSRS